MIAGTIQPSAWHEVLRQRLRLWWFEQVMPERNATYWMAGLPPAWTGIPCQYARRSLVIRKDIILPPSVRFGGRAEGPEPGKPSGTPDQPASE